VKTTTQAKKTIEPPEITHSYPFREAAPKIDYLDNLDIRKLTKPTTMFPPAIVPKLSKNFGFGKPILSSEPFEDDFDEKSFMASFARVDSHSVFGKCSAHHESSYRSR
jgi:hypothetical protein